jgi:hypothetical protein
VIFFLLALLATTVQAQTPELQTEPVEVVPAATATVSPTQTDYEVDYEEEPATDEVELPVEEKPKLNTDKKNKLKKNMKEPVLQGSRAEKKIAPLMKSEAKSIYKKNGKSLDVDTD